jgi:hypothetical protein
MNGSLRGSPNLPANQKFVDDYNNARRIVDAAASHASPNQPTPAPTPAAKKV